MESFSQNCGGELTGCPIAIVLLRQLGEVLPVVAAKNAVERKLTAERAEVASTTDKHLEREADLDNLH